MRGRSASSVFANPVLVGAVTVLVVIVAVFLSYNANNGLPFVPTTSLKVRFANGAEPGQGQRDPLGRLPRRRRRGHEAGAAVRRPRRRRAQAQARQDDRRGPRGLALAHPPALGARPQVPRAHRGQLEDGVQRRRHGPARADRGQRRPRRGLQDVRREDARAPASENLQGFGDAFAGRGAAVGRTVEEAPRLFGHLEPVARNLADPQTAAAALLQGARRRRARRRPGLRDATRACSRRWPTRSRPSPRDPEALQQFIAKQPPTMDAAIASFQVQRPFLRELTAFSDGLLAARPPSCAARCRDINPALETGTPRPAARRPSSTSSSRARSPRSSDLTSAPTTNAAHPRPRPRRSTRSTRSCASTARTSRSATLRTTSSPTSPSTSPRPTDRPVAARAAQQRRPPGRLARLDRRRRAGQRRARSSRATSSTCTPTPYGAAVTPDGRADCEAGQRGYLERNARFDDKTLQDRSGRRARRARQGPTFTGRARVPEGQTFTASPETGPYAEHADVHER